jgi:hypothetical protein
MCDSSHRYHKYFTLKQHNNNRLRFVLGNTLSHPQLHVDLIRDFVLHFCWNNWNLQWSRVVSNEPFQRLPSRTFHRKWSLIRRLLRPQGFFLRLIPYLATTETEHRSHLIDCFVLISPPFATLWKKHWNQPLLLKPTKLPTINSNFGVRFWSSCFLYCIGRRQPCVTNWNQ